MSSFAVAGKDVTELEKVRYSLHSNRSVREEINKNKEEKREEVKEVTLPSVFLLTFIAFVKHSARQVASPQRQKGTAV